MSPKDIRKKLSAVESVFSESATTIEKLKSVKTLLRGIHPALDAKLAEYGKHLDLLEKAEQGAVIELSAEAMPENTEEEKKRKAALLLFLKKWNDLKSEVARISAELDVNSESGGSAASLAGKIFSAAKGPLGIITVLALAFAALQTTAVAIEIKNDGCNTIQASGSLPPLPGLSLPNGPIVSGASGTAVLPPLSFDVDGTSPGSLRLSSLGFTMTFHLSGVDDITFNGESLIGKTTTLSLGGSKEHTLQVVCN